MIIRAEVLTSSQDDDLRRVKVKSEGIYDESPLIESVNGLFLRPGEIVYVDVSDGYEAPFIIGRCGNWIDADEILALFNKLIDLLNKTRQDVANIQSKYDGHTHVVPQSPSGVQTSETTTSLVSSTESDADKIEMKEIFHEDS